MGRLNGWQRLWLVVTVLATILGVVAAIVLMPTRSQILSSWVHDTINVVKQPNEYAYQIRDSYKDIGDRDLIERIQKKHASDPSKQLQFHDIDQEHTRQLQGLLGRQTRSILTALAVCGGLSLVLYAAGWSVGWIYRGFKR